MNNIKKLQSKSPYNQLIITDTTMIRYFTDLNFEVGERFIALIVSKDKEPVLILNSLFINPDALTTVIYEDGDDTTSILMKLLESQDIGIDGSMQARFLLPLLHHYTFHDASTLLYECRNIKTPEEAEKMIHASKLNDMIMEKIIGSLEEGIRETEVAAIAKKLYTSHPFSNVSFEPIVLFGENSWDPHGVPSNRKLKSGDIVLIDIGGMVDGYASDMTRCVFTGENKELEAIYNIVLEANKAAIKAVRTGVPLSSVDKAARDVIENAGFGEYFVHRTGHGIGIEAHESLDVSKSNHQLIEDGMCFSIEPGIYIEGLGGIRIEDLVLVKDGVAHVMNAYPKSIEFLSL